MLKNVSRVFNFSTFPTCTLERPSEREAGLLACSVTLGISESLVTVLFCCLNSVCQESTFACHDSPGDHKHPRVYVSPALSRQKLLRGGFHSAEEWPPLLSPKGLCSAREPQNSCKITSMPRWPRELYHWAATLLLGMWSRQLWDTSLLLYTRVGKWADTVGIE